jgi:ribonuclease P protein component
MLPKRSRLSVPAVRKVLAEGRRLRESFMSLKYVANKGLFAAAVVVSKRVAKSAVKRNSIRRSIYRALRAITLPSSGQMVIIVERIPESFDEVQSTLTKCFKHI